MDKGFPGDPPDPVICRIIANLQGRLQSSIAQQALFKMRQNYEDDIIISLRLISINFEVIKPSRSFPVPLRSPRVPICHHYLPIALDN
jgi:hypothetical protein